MNPYTILALDQQASSKEIIAAAALALRKRQYSGQEIAAAQRALLDPVAKAVHDFLLFPGLTLSSPPSLSPGASSAPPADLTLKRLAIFDPPL